MGGLYDQGLLLPGLGRDLWYWRLKAGQLVEEVVGVGASVIWYCCASERGLGNGPFYWSLLHEVPACHFPAVVLQL